MYSKYPNPEIVESSTILIIEFGFGDITLTEKNRLSKRKSSGNPILSTKEIKNKRKKKGAQWGNPLENYGCSLQLVELKNKKEITVGET